MANLLFSDIGLDHVDYNKVGNKEYEESSEEIYGVSLSTPTPLLFLGCQYADLPTSLGSRLGLPFTGLCSERLVGSSPSPKNAGLGPVRMVGFLPSSLPVLRLSPSFLTLGLSRETVFLLSLQ